MPTSQEKVTQIEAVLRQRFFVYVPKIVNTKRANWTENQHDTDRLTRALAAYALVNLADLDDAIAAAAITDGEDDFGIDAAYFDRANLRLLLVQSKFKRTGTPPSQEENLKTINGVRALLQRRFTEFNQNFQQRLSELEEALDTPGISLKISLIFLGDNFSPHVTNDLNALKLEIPGLEWESHGLTQVYDWLIAEQIPQPVTIDVTLEYWAQINSPRKAIYGQMGAAQLADLVRTHDKALFERNIRHYLGSFGVNNAIAETVRRRPDDLFYLNNGLTAVADTITSAAPNPARCKFRLTNFSIVNGAQTAGAIFATASLGVIAPEARVLITVIEVGNAPDDISRRITKARNYQNVVRGVDFAALDPEQERLRQELALMNVTYHYRPSADARVRREDAFTIEDAALALACFSFPILDSQTVQQKQVYNQSYNNAVDFAVDAKKEISQLWNQDGSTYPALFNAQLSGVRMGRLVQIYRFIDKILADTERAEYAFFRRMFFRHGRYFIMAFVAQRAQIVLNRPAVQLSQEDKDALSLAVNEIAELIYAESTPLQDFRGYLAIFRNLTDAQPLADKVLQRWTQPATPVALPSVAPPAASPPDPITAQPPTPPSTAPVAPLTPPPSPDTTTP